ncbi:hypothetical protein CF319_g9570 [Tilletia indica]|nr:hypothetical protein CF319_g9570 [Tilletia indica]
MTAHALATLPASTPITNLPPIHHPVAHSPRLPPVAGPSRLALPAASPVASSSRVTLPPMASTPMPAVAPRPIIRRAPRVTPVPKAVNPPGCLSETYMVGMHTLPNTVEQYAAIDEKAWSGYKLHPDVKAQLEALNLQWPTFGARKALGTELDRRARGQGVPAHRTSVGWKYDPSRPYEIRW